MEQLQQKSEDNRHEHLRGDWYEDIVAKEDQVLEKLRRSSEECVLVVRSYHHEHGDPAVYVVPRVTLPEGIESVLERLNGRQAVECTDCDYQSWRRDPTGSPRQPSTS